MTATQSTEEIRFGFGRNWQKFLTQFTPERQEIAKTWLLNFLKMDDLRGKTFIDIGSGSGINSAAAYLAGASRILSFDYDQHSVAATTHLRSLHGNPDHWQIVQGSILDADFCATLGKFDIVYSWGVLHHTGDQWTALRNCGLFMGPESRLYIALYAKEAHVNPPPEYWLDIKQRYNRGCGLTKRFMEMQYIWRHIMGRQIARLPELFRMMNHYKKSRGMEFMTDVRDWLGGWPMEFSSAGEVTELCAAAMECELVSLKLGEANTEFLFVPRGKAASMGYNVIDLRLLPEKEFPVLTDLETLPKGQPIYIFGTAHGGELVYNALRKIKDITIAGFVNVEREAEKFGLPVHHVDDFVKQVPTETPVILANRYVAENGARLRAAGFPLIYNGHPLVQKLHRGG